jgi:hypothetical protein
MPIFSRSEVKMHPDRFRHVRFDADLEEQLRDSIMLSVPPAHDFIRAKKVIAR